MQSPVKIWRNQTNIAQLLGKTGKIISWTLIRVPPGDFMDQAPYPVVLIELEDGKRIEAQLVDWDTADLEFGRSVRTVIRRVMRPDPDGVIPYGIKVKPV
jgi:uncharacterized OB-fold protein